MHAVTGMDSAPNAAGSGMPRVPPGTVQVGSGRRYRPAARHARSVDASTSDCGIRVVKHAPGP